MTAGRPPSEFRMGNERKGIIFNIQRFSIHDGPGIRTTIFFKGCPLRCFWCANPESQELLPQLMIRDVKCVSCGKCAQFCPREAISVSPEHGRQIRWDLCDQCFQCVEACLYGALAVMGRYVDSKEIIQEVEKDRLFYKNSGGGVTLSGGEPLGQPQFALTLLRDLKERGYHTALDTCGVVPEQIFAEILSYTDLVLFDIKQLDDQKHRQSTGVGNREILSNARFAASRVKTWFRVPLIEGLNDSPEDMEILADMARELKVERVSFLPYHEGGLTKRHQIGKEVSRWSARAPQEDRIQRLKKIVEERGVSATVGT